MRENVAYQSAKRGESDQAAVTLVLECIADEAMQKIRAQLRGRKPRVVAVHAEEAKGRNKIPIAYAETLAGVLDLTTEPGIVQISVANHSEARSIFHRLVSQPIFSGYVEKGAEYLIVDDTCTAGGTLANLKGFIELNGGIVVGMSVLSLNSHSLEYEISLAPQTLSRLNYRHKTLASLWQQEFGHGIDTVTEGEAGHLLAAPSVDTIRNRLTEARRDLHLRGDQSDSSGKEAASAVVDQTTAEEALGESGRVISLRRS